MTGRVARGKNYHKLRFVFNEGKERAQAITSSQLCMRLRTSMFGYRI